MSTQKKNTKKRNRPQINSLEELEKYQKEHRSEDMLTVADMIDWLKKQNPKACILGFEPNSNAWIEQFKDLPSMSIRTVKQEKESEREHLQQWYRHDPEDVRNKKIEEEMKTVFRYAEDDDIVIRF